MNDTPPLLLADWVAGWSVGWLACWLVVVSEGFLKESYRNPYEIQPDESLRNPIRFVQMGDSQLALPPWLPPWPGWGGSFIFIFQNVLIICAMFWGSL